MSRFVRSSKFRHVFGTAAKYDNCFDNVKVSSSAWDTNLITVNPKFIAINWNAAGGGAFSVIPHKNVGKVADNLPLFAAHSAPVLDTDFARFNDYVIASASEDSRVMIWNIPEELPDPEADDYQPIQPVAKLGGHARKVGHVLFHPVADNVLASSSIDLTVRLWDIEKGVQKQELTGFTDYVQSLAWNYNGSLLATVGRDKKLRIFDVRSNKIEQQTDGHQGIKGSRVVWLGDTDRIVTTGFSRMSDRQIFVWNTAKLDRKIHDVTLDMSSGILMPFYDDDTKILFIAGKGDGNIRYYEFENDSLFYLSMFQSNDPQRGLAFMPKRALNLSECEIARGYKVAAHLIEPISFVVPRKSDAFQPDIYPPTFSDEPSLTADEYFAGKNANPKLVNLENGFVAKERKELVSQTKEEGPSSSPPKTEKEYIDAYHNHVKEIAQLKEQLAMKDVTIRSLTAQLESLKVTES